MDFWKDGRNQENNFCPGTVCACQTLNFDEEVIWARKNLGYAGKRGKITSHTAQETCNAGKRFYDEGYAEGKHGVTDFARSVWGLNISNEGFENKRNSIRWARSSPKEASGKSGPTGREAATRGRRRPPHQGRGAARGTIFSVCGHAAQDSPSDDLLGEFDRNCSHQGVCGRARVQ